jgi:hypothetical protein
VVSLARAELGLGNGSRAIARLTRVLQDHPLVEPVVAELMRVLSHEGRTAEALDHYTKLRRRLVEQLGVDPGPELQAIHLSILRGESDRRSPANGNPTAMAPSRLVPAQLPAGVSGFTGRDAELAQLDDVLDGTAESAISAVSGTAGVGKTALCLRWAHRCRDRFPDGQLYVDLRGYDPAQPLTPEQALARLLTAVGVATRDIPPDVEPMAARYRTEVDGRRMLILLDNAASEEQVRSLLPGTPSCVVVVTSRDQLAGLVAVPGAHRLDLDLLPMADAVDLLRRLIGPRVEAEPAAATTLAEQCARLPLALRVAAELAISRPANALRDLVVDLGDHQRRLTLLDAGGDPRAAVAAVFSWSIRHLPPDLVRVFRLVGLHPGADFDAYSAAALAGIDPERARGALGLLARAHLLQRTNAGRFTAHGLLRAYATHLATVEDSEDGGRAALGAPR